MIMTVDELKKFIKTDESDEVLEVKLQALESLVRSYTNNSFQLKHVRFNCPVNELRLNLTTSLLKVGDTIQISQSIYNDGVYTIRSIDDGIIELDKMLIDEIDVLVTKVEYPMDVKMGAANMLKWDLDNRTKVGIQSETISRHSVSYFNMDGDNSSIGYPKSLTGFLRPYMKVRF